MTFKSTIDLSAALGGIKRGGEKGVRLAAEHLLTEGNKGVPHDEGTLERSGRASSEGLRGAFSWDTPYAVVQHEDMTLHHDGKGEAKWAENAMTREKDTVGRIIANAIRQEAGT